MYIPSRRRLTPLHLIAVLATLASVASSPASAAPGDPFEQVLNASLSEKKGVVLYVNGQAIPGRVTKVDNESVELSSREFSRIVVRRDRINAVAGN
jgi:hypothetical protein